MNRPLTREFPEKTSISCNFVLKKHFQMNKIPLLAFFLAFFAVSCKKDNTPFPVITTGNMTGNVALYDERSNRLPSSEGMTVSIDGTGFSTTTLSNGNFSFSNVPNDLYTLTFSKQGFGTYKLIGYPHTATGSSTSVIPGKSLGQLSTTTVEGHFTFTYGDSVRVGANINPAATGSERRGYRIFFGENSTVSKDNYKFFTPVYSTANTPSVTFAKDQFTAKGFAPGSTVYFRFYGDSFFSNEYLDESTGKTVFPNLNPNSFGALFFQL